MEEDYRSSYTGPEVDAKLGMVKAMGASGSSHSAGLVPDTPSTAGTTKFLREDGTWQDPSYPNVGLPVGSGTATSLANLPVTNRMIVATVSANQASVSISNGVSALTAGCELHVVVKATAAVTITLPTSSPYVNMNADTTLSLAANGYAEINFISDGTNIYVRAIQ